MNIKKKVLKWEIHYYVFKKVNCAITSDLKWSNNNIEKDLKVFLSVLFILDDHFI